MNTFKRGVHPKDCKSLSADAPIRSVLPGEKLIFPLSQHIGAPAKPVVAPGDTVKVGQLIAEAGGFVSAPVHSSVSGTVEAISPMLTLKGENEDCIIVKNDGLYEETEGYGQKRDAFGFGPSEIISAVKDAGIVGLGGAGFPMHVKLSVKDPSKIDFLIVNGAECEPYLTSDYRLMLERADDLIRGVEYLLRIFPNAKGVIGIESNKPKAIELLSAKAGGRISVSTLKAKYPQGGERMLIYAVTGRKLNSSLLPADLGCVVVNVASVIAATEAIEYGIPLTERVMTVTGDAVNTPCNLKVHIGDIYSHVLEEAGGFSCNPEKVLSGGPMMGIPMYSMEVPVVKTAASILAYRHDPAAVNISPCIRCGKCMLACPEKLVPQMLTQASDHDRFDLFEKYGGMECIECGSCAYVCPAKRHLVQSMRYGKRETAKIIKARKAAEGGSNGK